tara:strand:- start:71 stop:373 length:303 start_codon:yes stop_codon:yes gene_type:complete
MSTKKPFIVKNGLAVNDTIVIGDNGKLHANNTISNGSITQSMLDSSISLGSGSGSSSADFGTFSAPLDLVLDFGSFSITQDTDFGTFSSPSILQLDFKTF